MWSGVAAVGGVLALVSLMLGFEAGSAHRTVHAQTASQAEPNPRAAETVASYEGVVTDTKCGAKHTSRISENAADCTRVCLHAGEKFALVDGDKMFVLTGEAEGLKRVAGERVTIQGTLNGNQIAVVAIRPLSR